MNHIDKKTQELLFGEFKNSFSYGSRPDLNFKFLKSLTEKEAADFIQAYFRTTADALNSGDVSRVHDLIYEWQHRAYSGASRFIYDMAPFTPMRKPLAQSRLALISSSGHFVSGDDPEPFGVKDMTQEEAQDRIMDFLRAEPVLSEIPTDTLVEDLRVRHGGYDIRAAQADPNVNLPVTRLREFEAEGRIGEFASPAYSFMGACSQTRLIKRTGPKWVRLLQERAIDAALLVPV